MNRASAPRTLSHAQARAFYDRFAWLQEWQALYEAPALQLLIGEGRFAEANAVLELGCGTGRLALELLAHVLPTRARYLGLDVSPTMIRRTRRRLAPFGARAEARLTDGAMSLPVPEAAVDRVVAAYVLDLLSEADIQLALAEAHRVLVPGGRLCLACLAPGTSPASRLLCRVWSSIHAAAPALVGGCRPLDLAPFLDARRWRLACCQTSVSYAVPTQVLVAIAQTPET